MESDTTNRSRKSFIMCKSYYQGSNESHLNLGLHSSALCKVLWLGADNMHAHLACCAKFQECLNDKKTSYQKSHCHVWTLWLLGVHCQGLLPKRGLSTKKPAWILLFSPAFTSSYGHPCLLDCKKDGIDPQASGSVLMANNFSFLVRDYGIRWRT